MTPEPRWTPLTALAARFDANVAALAGRYPDLAHELRSHVPPEAYAIRAVGDTVRLGVGTDPVRPVNGPLTPARAAATTAALFPTGAFTEPALVAGEDLGWLWDRLYRLPCASPASPGWRPPLYLVLPDLERLWVLLHVHDWPLLLADPRVRLFAGPGAIDQLARGLVQDRMCPWPKQWVTADPAAWPAGVSFEALVARATTARAAELTRATAGVEPSATFVPAGRRLRILGVTSRYSTFIQHSMRDWLAGFAALGHDTRLLIEGADHESLTTLVVAEACAAFRPDLVVIIDHYRAKMSGLPAHVPVAMWVQDRLPTLFCPEAGAAQGPRDFCLGFGRLHLSTRHGYPARRFLPTPIGVNAERFAPRQATAAERAAFGCDVAYVSHASTPADALLAKRLENATPAGARYLTEMVERMRAHYECGGAVLTDPELRRMMAATAADRGTFVTPEQSEAMLGFLRQEIGNALFRHQALAWAADAGVDLRLYGRGWERHPTLARFARGEAGNADQLAAIYRASKVNLQVTPFGAVHPRLLDGVAAGAFFLIRHSPGDAVGRPHRALWDWCQQHGVTDDATLLAEPTLRDLIRTINQKEGFADLPRDLGLYDVCAAHADADFMVAADSVWGDDYDAVAFRDRAELHGMLNWSLTDDDARRAVADSMRRAVIDRVSYAAINRRLLDLISRELAPAEIRQAA